MSRGNNLQEMEAGTKQSKTAVNNGAAGGDAMQKLAPGAVAGQSGSWEDLGGPTPENYRSDDNSAQLTTPGKTLKSVSDVVNKGAKAAEPMQHLSPGAVKGSVKEEEELDDEDLIDEEIIEDDEIIEAKEDEDQEDADEKPKKGKKGKDDEGGQEEDDDEEDDKEDMDEEFSIEEDVNALLEGEELSEEFQEKARMIFEAALRSKVSEIKESLQFHYDQALVEEVQEIKLALQERVDTYLEYISEEWVSENALSIEVGLKTQMTESFLSGMKGLFEDHYVSIPEDKYDVLESMVEKLDDMEIKLNEQIEKNISLNKRLSESVANGIFDEISEGLAVTQKEKLASLAESVEFGSDVEYREKIETLKESYFPSRTSTQQAQPETLSEGVGVAPEYHSDTMNAYLRTLSAVAKK